MATPCKEHPCLSIFCAYLLCGLGLVVAAHAGAASLWPDSTRADLAFIYKTLQENHPGTVDDQNGSFGAWLDRGMAEATASAKLAASQANQQQVVERYLAGFGDANLQLQWKQDAERRAPAPAKGSFALAEVAQSVHWLALPTFATDARQQKELLAVMPALEHLDKVDTIVFDLRGNRGGHAALANAILHALYDADYLNELHWQDGRSHTEWRASAGNLQHLATLKASYTTGQLALHETVQHPPKKGMPRRRSSATPVLLTDASCVAECLAFADSILLIPGARHIGQATGTDSVYLSPRKLELPSKLATLSFPQAVLCGRKRAHGAPLVPVSTHAGPMSDDDKVRAWALANLR